ncbi:hypothetical protein [Microbacterium kyungheense]|uniref:Uncharacterized protein n=1 Tax=Microbacterium kyungheense TaxID=1263636 RepID=A0A543F1L6_9MICO|nr:hypothetical protein [Microbacterium kyungheense]TQM27714.1 hypothetical protein FB391_1741 [Microbacterium kyungheense]
MSDLSDVVGRAVLADAGISAEDRLTDADHLALIAAGARAEGEVRELLQRAVTAARAGGVSWARIGGELGMTRQAAQQRFGSGAPPARDAAPDDERWLGPVTAFDEMAELELAGQAGWHTVEADVLSHRMVRTDTQWEHRRILWRSSLAAETADGWEVGCRAFPWIYLVRDRGIPPVTAG